MQEQEAARIFDEDPRGVEKPMQVLTPQDRVQQDRLQNVAVSGAAQVPHFGASWSLSASGKSFVKLKIQGAEKSEGNSVVGKVVIKHSDKVQRDGMQGDSMQCDGTQDCPRPLISNQVHDDYAAPGQDELVGGTAIHANGWRIRSERTNETVRDDSVTCNEVCTVVPQAPPSTPRVVGLRSLGGDAGTMVMGRHVQLV